MAVMNGDATEKTNGSDALPPLVVEDGENKQTSTSTSTLSSDKPKTDYNYNYNPKKTAKNDVNLKGVLEHLFRSIFDQNYANYGNGIRKLLIEVAPMFRQAIVNARRDLLVWTRRDNTHLRGLLVVSAGIVTLLALTGVLAFTLFFAAATVNAIVISLLISLAAMGGFLAIFFACLTAMYVGVLFIAAFVTFTIAISSIIAALVAAGWIGFIWITWFTVSKGATFAKRYLSIAFAANTSGQHNTATFGEPVAQ